MHVYPLNRYVPGDQKAVCDRCGFHFLLSELVEEERTHYMVCRNCYDPPHPQDNKRYRLPERQRPGHGESSGYTEVTGTGEALYVDEP